TPPPVTASITTAPVPANTIVNVPKASAAYLFIVPLPPPDAPKAAARARPASAFGRRPVERPGQPSHEVADFVPDAAVVGHRIALELPRPPLGHLAAAGVAGTEEQDLRFRCHRRLAISAQANAVGQKIFTRGSTRPRGGPARPDRRRRPVAARPRSSTPRSR